MKIFPSLLAILFCFNAYAQKLKFNREYLSAILENKQVIKFFKPCDDLSAPLVIIDTSYLFNETEYKTKCGRLIQISRIWPSGIEVNRKYHNDTTDMIIILAKKKKIKYHFFLYQPEENANMILEVGQKRKFFKIKVLKRGVF